MNTYWQNKRIWITGGSSGIGAALARACAARGARCVLSSNDSGGLEKVQNELAAEFGRGSVETVELDLEDEQSIVRAVSEVSEGDPVDVLINNAGVSQRSLFVDTAVEVTKRMIAVNLTGHILLTGALLPKMVKRGSGTIVGISSIAGLFGAPLRTGYGAAKRGILGFYESLKLELYTTGVGVVTVIPGFIRTEISKNALEADGARHGVMDRNQSGGIPPEQCARDIIRGIERGRTIVYTGLGGRGRMILFLKKWFPGLLNRILLKSEAM